jgi:hypothetical protein
MVIIGAAAVFSRQPTLITLQAAELEIRWLLI